MNVNMRNINTLLRGKDFRMTFDIETNQSIYNKINFDVQKLMHKCRKSDKRNKNNDKSTRNSRIAESYNLIKQ